MSRIDKLKTLLGEQKTLYASLLSLARRLRGGLESGADAEALLSLMAERESVVARLKEGDGLIGELLEDSAALGWFESAEAESLREELRDLVQRALDEDHASGQLILAAQDETQRQLGSLRMGQKTVSGYGQTGRPVFARFIDLKR